MWCVCTLKAGGTTVGTLYREREKETSEKSASRGKCRRYERKCTTVNNRALNSSTHTTLCRDTL